MKPELTEQDWIGFDYQHRIKDLKQEKADLEGYILELKDLLKVSQEGLERLQVQFDTIIKTLGSK